MNKAERNCRHARASCVVTRLARYFTYSRCNSCTVRRMHATSRTGRCGFVPPDKESKVTSGMAAENSCKVRGM